LKNIKLLHDHQLNDRSVFFPTFLQYEYRDIIFEIVRMIKVEEKEDDLGFRESISGYFWYWTDG